jgi:hypothetical protein
MENQGYDLPTFARILLADIYITTGRPVNGHRPSPQMITCLHRQGLPPIVAEIRTWLAQQSNDRLRDVFYSASR